MRPCFVRSVRRVLAASAITLTTFAAAPLAAQVVTPRTIPILQDGQFALYPSTSAAMGGLGIAIADTLLDAFNNPATARRAQPGFFTTPFMNAVSEDQGSATTLPLGGYWSAGKWSGAALVALQRLSHGNEFNVPITEHTSTNKYATATLGRSFGAWSLGGGVSLAGIRAVNGVEQMYAGSSRVRQSGASADYRLGATREFKGGRTLEGIVLYSRWNMTHDVRFQGWRWDSVMKQSVIVTRDETNQDRANTVAMHARYQVPLHSPGQLLGFSASVNRTTHPHIPNYRFMNVPRDPGTTWAGNFGVGTSKTLGGDTFGVELAYEPISTTTWADVARDTVLGGRAFVAGQHTMDNTMRFGNVHARIGFEHKFGGEHANPERWSALQWGLGLYMIDYRLSQHDRVALTSRTQDESWAEWSPTVGFRTHGKAMDFMMSLRLTCATGDCIPLPRGDAVQLVSPTPSTGGVVAAPSRPVDFQSGMATVFQLSVIVPIR